MAPPAIRFENVSKAFHTRAGHTIAVRDLSFEIATSRFVSLVGASGCGKSTILNLIAGLISPDEGRIEIGGATLDGLNREATYLFQQDVLLPWKSVLENVILGLRLAGEPRAKASESGKDWLARMGLEKYGNAYPRHLSGGMRRRVAIAQNWILERPLILMDEPFSALDVHTRMQMESELLSLWENGPRKTVLFVTHDLEEAIRLSDEVMVLKNEEGRSVGSRHEVPLPRPRDARALRDDAGYNSLHRALWEKLQPSLRAEV